MVRRELQKTYGKDIINERDVDKSGGINKGTREKPNEIFAFWPWLPPAEYYSKYTFEPMPAKKTVGIVYDIWTRTDMK